MDITSGHVTGAVLAVAIIAVAFWVSGKVVDRREARRKAAQDEVDARWDRLSRDLDARREEEWRCREERHNIHAELARQFEAFKAHQRAEAERAARPQPVPGERNLEL